MLGNIYKKESERIKVISQTKGGYKCIKWLNGNTDEVILNKDQLNLMEYICTVP